MTEVIQYSKISILNITSQILYELISAVTRFWSPLIIYRKPVGALSNRMRGITKHLSHFSAMIYNLSLLPEQVTPGSGDLPQRLV